jgi:hypothetical protein
MGKFVIVFVEVLVLLPIAEISPSSSFVVLQWHHVRRVILSSVHTRATISGNSTATEPRHNLLSRLSFLVRISWLLNLSVLEMSSDEEATLFYWYLRHRKQKCKKYWVHPFFTFNLTYSYFVVARVLDQDPVKFRNLYRRNIESFKLIGNCGTRNKDTNSEKA